MQSYSLCSDPKEKVIPRVHLRACLDSFLVEEVINDFKSGSGIVTKSTRLATLPDYLIVQLRRFQFGPNWQPMKLGIGRIFFY